MPLRAGHFLRRMQSLARNSPWVMIAVGLHVILAATLSVVYLRHERRKTLDLPTTIAVSTTRQAEVPKLELPPEPDRHQIPERAKEVELVPFDEEFIPTDDAPAVVDWHEDYGDPTGSDEDMFSSTGGTSIGVGEGGHYGTGVPAPFGGREAKERTLLPQGQRPGGPLEGTEESVLEGLRWLMRHQNEDGSWSAVDLALHCSEKHPCIPPDAGLDRSFDVGMTGLALLAFLGSGISTGSRAMIGDRAMGMPPRPAAAVVKKGLEWLLARQNEDGSFSPGFELPENHTLATMALCEAYGLARGNRRLKEPAQRALAFLVAAQRRDADGRPAGWGPGSWSEIVARHERGELDDEALEEERAGADLSITCWVVMALHSARTAGFAVPDDVLAGALAFSVDATGTGALSGDENAFTDPEDRFTAHAARRSALGMLVRTFAGGDVSDPFLATAARDIAADVPHVSKDMLSVDFYYWYFATLALIQYDGPDSPRAGAGELWKPWNAGLVDALLPLQDRSKKPDLCARGGWLQEARGNRRGRALYNTALNVLTLEVYYRFDNVFGSAARGK